MRAEFLIRKLDLNGLTGTFELNFRGHRLVSRARARDLIDFLHKNNQHTNGGSSPTAWLRLRSRLERQNRIKAWTDAKGFMKRLAEMAEAGISHFECSFRDIMSASAQKFCRALHT